MRNSNAWGFNSTIDQNENRLDEAFQLLADASNGSRWVGRCRLLVIAQRGASLPSSNQFYAIVVVLIVVVVVVRLSVLRDALG